MAGIYSDCSTRKINKYSVRIATFGYKPLKPADRRLLREKEKEQQHPEVSNATAMRLKRTSRVSDGENN